MAYTVFVFCQNRIFMVVRKIKGKIAGEQTASRDKIVLVNNKKKAYSILCIALSFIIRYLSIILFAFYRYLTGINQATYQYLVAMVTYTSVSQAYTWSIGVLLET